MKGFSSCSLYTLKPVCSTPKLPPFPSNIVEHSRYLPIANVSSSLFYSLPVGKAFSILLVRNFRSPSTQQGWGWPPSHKRQGMVGMARAQTACRATARVARTRTRERGEQDRLLVRATLARASWRTIFFPLNTSSLDAYGMKLATVLAEQLLLLFIGFR
jgi:hypothetical protein